MRLPLCYDGHVGCPGIFVSVWRAVKQEKERGRGRLMDRRFVIQRSYAEATRDHSAQSYMTAFRLFCPRYLDTFTLSDGDDNDFVPSGRESLVVPVGGIEFVRECLRIQRDADVYPQADAVDVGMTPIEVPDALMPYVGRRYLRMRGCDISSEMLDGRRWFLKDAETLKRWNSALYDFGGLGHMIDADTEYVVSERVIFLSEWRVFVHRDEVIACQNYLGDPLSFPDSQTIRDMVAAYASVSHPSAYTLDIGLVSGETGSQTVPIEVHPFVSCGLYGMFDMAIPDMLAAGYEWYLHQAVA